MVGSQRRSVWGRLWLMVRQAQARSWSFRSARRMSTGWGRRATSPWPPSMRWRRSSPSIGDASPSPASPWAVRVHGCLRRNIPIAGPPRRRFVDGWFVPGSSLRFLTTSFHGSEKGTIGQGRLRNASRRCRYGSFMVPPTPSFPSGSRGGWPRCLERTPPTPNSPGSDTTPGTRRIEPRGSLPGSFVSEGADFEMPSKRSGVAKASVRSSGTTRFHDERGCTDRAGWCAASSRV